MIPAPRDDGCPPIQRFILLVPRQRRIFAAFRAEESRGLHQEAHPNRQHHLVDLGSDVGLVIPVGNHLPLLSRDVGDVP